MVRFLVPAFVLVASLASAQQATNDLFNRANSTNLGPDWTEIDGNTVIVNNALQGASGFQLAWCAHNVFQAPYAQTVLRANFNMNGTGGHAVSLIAGVNTATWSAIEVRIADNNGDGLADRIFFNAAVNAGAWFTSTSFQNIGSPLASGIATVWFTNNGATVNVELRDPVANSVQSFSNGGIPAGAITSQQVAFGCYSTATLDDVQAWVGVPTAPAFTITTPRVNTAPVLLVTGAAPLAPVVIAYSSTGAGPIPTALGPVALSDPISIFATIGADSAGRVALGGGTLSPGLLGVVLYVQALDVAAPALSNHFVLTIL